MIKDKGKKTTAFKTYLYYAGGSYDLRKALKVSRQLVHYWSKYGVPINRIKEISQVTGITIKDLLNDTILLKTNKG